MHESRLKRSSGSLAAKIPVILAVLFVGVFGLIFALAGPFGDDLKRLIREGKKATGVITEVKTAAMPIRPGSLKYQKWQFIRQEMKLKVEYIDAAGQKRAFRESWPHEEKENWPEKLHQGEPVRVFYLPENRWVKEATEHHPYIRRLLEEESHRGAYASGGGE